MSTNKRIGTVCVIITVLALIVTVLFMNGERLGLRAAQRVMGYESTLFDTSRVHTLDIVIDDWDGFLETCESETYSACTVVIDNEAVKNVAIRGKGNTSLSTVKTMGSQRYSFKIEFDHFESGKNYHGLDKLSLNNIIQDNTYMKDYLAYCLMDEFGADSPLCSFVYITVNGEDWGLYLAVEGVEDSFLRRNYGTDAGELYKPDSMSFGGGGPGNGKGFNMEDFLNRDAEDGSSEESESGGSTQERSGMPQVGGRTSEGFDPSQFSGKMPEDFDPSQFAGREKPSDSGESGGGRRGGSPFGGMGSSDVKLQYIDDDPDSYANIFDNAKTDVSKKDQARLIAALKTLGEFEDAESVVDADEVLRYFVVHNFVCNGDSYTGSIIHNYYLHEKDGKLAMIPWDYNLAFGTFQSANTTEIVNDPIDTPMSVSDPSDRPMWGWIVSSEEYTQRYHEYFAEFLDTVDITAIIDEAYDLIKPYVEKDPTAFCTVEDFETGVETLREFCALRAESVRGQLDGTIPTTDEGQSEDASTRIDASAITLSDMGSMGGGGGGFGGFGGRGNREGDERTQEDGESSEGGSFTPPSGESGSFTPPSGENGSFTPPSGGSGSFTPPSGGSGSFTPPSGEGGSFTPPSGFTPSEGEGTAKSLSQFGTETWILLGASAILLAAGLLIGKKYRR